ncbi:hypothetical protein BGZ57DRAFT_864795 [Hyaloscypha finlandica]|nr:hypothetical protein BGZ57DRAFT_864795 [Hyaloscypha finlandica]
MIYIGVSWMFLNCAVDPAIPDSPLYSNHAGYYNLRPGFISLSGERQYPASALFMNLPKPLSNMLGLLKHNDARSLFHEPGHAIHNQTTRTRQPPQQLDDETIQNLMKSKHTNEALATLKQCHMAMFDMVILSEDS